MLAPPNNGSAIANLVKKYIPYSAHFIKPVSQLGTLPDAYIHQVAIPKNIHIGVITGKYDNIVPPNTAHITNQHDYLCVSANHTFIMNNSKARNAIVNLLAFGQFQDR